MPASIPTAPRVSSVPSDSAAAQSGGHALDNPIFHALGTHHIGVARIHGTARRYPSEIGPLAGIPGQSEESYADLRILAGASGIVVLFLRETPALAPGWTLVRGGSLDQMICLRRAPREQRLLPLEAEIRELTAADAPLMVDLARLTEPGPFELRTMELGRFFGIFHGCRLVAMAGQRMSVPGFIEVSAVCTHPDFRGRGYAAAAMSKVMADIVERGRTPILHSLSSNAGAIAVYRQLGFTLRRNFELAVIANDR